MQFLQENKSSMSLMGQRTLNSRMRQSQSANPDFDYIAGNPSLFLFRIVKCETKDYIQEYLSVPRRKRLVYISFDH